MHGVRTVSISRLTPVHLCTGIEAWGTASTRIPGRTRNVHQAKHARPRTGPTQARIGGAWGVCRKRGAWWIDWYEGRRRLRKKTAAATKTETKKLLERVKAKMLPRSLGLFDPKLKCAERVTRYLEALKGPRRERMAETNRTSVSREGRGRGAPGPSRPGEASRA